MQRIRKPANNVHSPSIPPSRPVVLPSFLAPSLSESTTRTFASFLFSLFLRYFVPSSPSRRFGASSLSPAPTGALRSRWREESWTSKQPHIHPTSSPAILQI